MNSSPWFRYRLFSPLTRSRPLGRISCTTTVIEPCNRFCWVLDDPPEKSRDAPAPMSVFRVLPATVSGLMPTLLALSNLVLAVLLACVVSCSTTVTTSPARNARLSDTSDQEVSGMKTPPDCPLRATPLATGNGSLLGPGVACGGAIVAQADNSATGNR